MTGSASVRREAALRGRWQAGQTLDSQLVVDKKHQTLSRLRDSEKQLGGCRGKKTQRGLARHDLIRDKIWTLKQEDAGDIDLYELGSFQRI